MEKVYKAANKNKKSQIISAPKGFKSESVDSQLNNFEQEEEPGNYNDEISIKLNENKGSKNSKYHELNHDELPVKNKNLKDLRLVNTKDQIGDRLLDEIFHGSNKGVFKNIDNIYKESK